MCNMYGISVSFNMETFVTKVWKQRTLWDGFIRCCQKTKPQSYTIMLQLPPQQLSLLLKEAEDLRDPLLVHVQVEDKIHAYNTNRVPATADK